MAHPSVELFEKCKMIVTNYPEDIVNHVKNQIEPIAFFPGGHGLWKEDPKVIPHFPFGGIMCVAEIFDHKDKLDEIEREYQETGASECYNVKNPFWRGIKDVYNSNVENLNDTFFTNAYMGVHIVEKKEFQKKVLKKYLYIEECQNFFIQQVQFQKPRGIVAIGVKVTNFLSNISPQLKCWAGKTINEFRDDSIIPDVSIGGHHAAVGFILNPVLRHLNDENKNYKGEKGLDADKLILRELLSVHGV